MESGKLAEPRVIIECRGDHRSSATSVVAAYPSMAARRFMKHELWLQKSVALD